MICGLRSTKGHSENLFTWKLVDTVKMHAFVIIRPRLMYLSLLSFSLGCPAMETEMIPKFPSKDEEINYWKLLSLKYKERYVELIVLKTGFFFCRLNGSPTLA